LGRFLTNPGQFLADLWRHVVAVALSAAHQYGPWLLAAALLASAAGWVVRRWQAARLSRGARYVEVFAPPEVDPAGAAQLWKGLHDALRPRWHAALTGCAHLTFELVWSQGGRLRIGVWVAGTVPPGVVEQAVEGVWPGAHVTTTAPRPPLPDGCLAAGGTLRLGLAEWYPLASDHAADPYRLLLATGGELRAGEAAVVQFLVRPVGVRRLRRAEQAARMLRTGRATSRVGRLLDLVRPGPATNPRAYSYDPTLSKDVAAILGKTAARPCWEIAIRYGVAAPLPPVEQASWASTLPTISKTRRRLRGRAHALASAFGVYAGRNHLRRHRLARPAAVLAARRMRRGDLVSLPELAALAHLPADASVPGLTRARARAVAPRPEIPTRGKVLGDAEAGGRRPVALVVADARYHLHLLGATGSGKSTLLANLVLDDVAAGRGAVVIDPKGDLVRDLLERLPDRAAGRLVLLDPDDRAAPPALSMLDGPDPELAVDHLVGIFRNVFAAWWGPRTDDTLRAACLTLLGVPQAGATLADVPRLLSDPAFRQRFTNAVPPRSALATFWASYDRLSAHGQAVMVGPVLSRLRAFLLRSFVADVVGSATSSFDMAKVLDGGLLLARLPKGQLGTETSRLLGSFVVAKTWQAALARAQRPEDARTDASLLIDECHNYLTLPVGFEEMFAEARGYRLSLVLAHQHLAQLPRELREAISANARNKLWFTMSPEDARTLERHVAPELSEHDLAHLDAYQAAARLLVGGRELAACTLRTRPAPAPVPGQAERLRAAARARHGRAADVRRHQQVSREARTADAPGRRGSRAVDLGHGQAKCDRQPHVHHDASADRWEEDEDWLPPWMARCMAPWIAPCPIIQQATSRGTCWSRRHPADCHRPRLPDRFMMNSSSRGPHRSTRTAADRLARQLAGLAGRLTDRDRELCRLVFEHRVLTTPQLAHLAFDNLVTAECRLVRLYRLDLLDRFRPRRDTGSAPYHYVLGGLGAALLAAERGIEPRELGWRRDKALAIAYSQRLGHIVGTNGFFTSLAGYARRHPRRGVELAEWWSERRCRATWGEIVQPDGFGRLRQHDRLLDFFLEYDNATEPTQRVAAKLDSYAELARAKDLFTPVLFWFPTPGREASVRRTLGRPELPVATAYAQVGRNPAEAVWLPLGLQHPRRRLIELADAGTWSPTHHPTHSTY